MATMGEGKMEVEGKRMWPQKGNMRNLGGDGNTPYIDTSTPATDGDTVLQFCEMLPLGETQVYGSILQLSLFLCN